MRFWLISCVFLGLSCWWSWWASWLAGLIITLPLKAQRWEWFLWTKWRPPPPLICEEVWNMPLPFGLKLKRTRRYTVSSKSCLVTRIQLLNGEFVEFTLSVESTGQECLEAVAQRLELREVCMYFHANTSPDGLLQQGLCCTFVLRSDSQTARSAS